MRYKIGVIGLGYVGLPLALEFAKHFQVVGYDINEERVELMKICRDPANEVDSKNFENKRIKFTSNPQMLEHCNFYVIAVPTDIKNDRTPNLKPLINASKDIGFFLEKEDIVVYESTVYPGCTEEVCVPILEKGSGLKLNIDFKVGYSPERIVPGDKERSLPYILKIISGSDTEALEVIELVYSKIIEAGLFKASSIKVAEAAKVIENTQRDINISLMNELSIIFDMMDIDTTEVIEAAGTKWNFHKYYPGLVGGHCISIDPFYLMHKAKELGHEPQVIAAGRKVNDFIPHFISKRLVKALIEIGKNPGDCKVLLQGITFKENVSDIRNSKVVDLIRELMSFSINVHITDPHASANEVVLEYNLTLKTKIDNNYDAIIIAVPHTYYKKLSEFEYFKLFKDKPIIFDLKKIRYDLKEKCSFYWCL